MERDFVKLAPSILAADFARLGEQVAEAEKAGADRIHVDVMDGHFVPNISMGAPIVKSLRRVTKLPLETHLMITAPDFFLEEFVEAGSDSFLVHWEGNNDLSRTIRHIKALGKRVGVAINPATSASVLEEIIEQLKETESLLVQTEKMVSLGRMSAGIIHEINNPLNYATTGLYSLRNKAKHVSPEQQEEYQAILHDVEDGMNRVKTIVSSLKTFTHPDTEQVDDHED